MLKKFEVTGYKNFKDKFVLDLSKIRDYKFNSETIRNDIVNTAIIYGRNAVGKTNFGNAVLDIKNNILNSEIVFMPNKSYLNADTERTDIEFSYEFLFDGQEVNYIYKKNDEGFLLYEELSIKSELIFKFDHVGKSLLDNNLELLGAQTLNWEFTDDAQSILSYIINNTSLTITNPIKKMYTFIRGMRLIKGNLLSGKTLMANKIVDDIVKNDLVNDFQSFLNRFGIDEKLIVIDSVTGDKILCFQHHKPIAFVQNCSSGTASLLQLFSWYRNIENATFLYLDEFDAFYHYELSEKIICLFKELLSCQTLTTSHNTDLLTNKIMRPDCLFILTKSRITALADATSRELREGHNLEKLYKSGEFDE